MRLINLIIIKKSAILYTVFYSMSIFYFRIASWTMQYEKQQYINYINTMPKETDFFRVAFGF